MHTPSYPITLRRAFTAALSSLGIILTGSSLHAATENWSGATNGIWGTASNWSTTTPDSTFDLTILGPANAAGTLNINIGASAAANSINFTNTAATTLTGTTTAQTLTLSSSGTAITTGTGAVTIGAGTGVNIALGASQTWSIGSGGLTATNVISDGGSVFGITKSGTGTLTLSGANTFTGGLTINAGTVSTSSLGNGGSNSGIGASSNAAANLVINGGTLKYTGAATSTDRNFTIGDSSATIDASGSGALTMSGAATYVTANAARTLTLTGTNTGNNTYGGILADNGSGALAVTKSAAGTWVLSGTNTYTGVTTISAGTLQFAKEVSLYNNTPSSWTATNLVVNSGATAAFNVGGTGEFTTADIATLIGLGTASGGFKSGSLIGLDTTNASGAVTYSGNIVNPNGGSNTLGLTKLGVGTLTLSGANTFSGGINANAGTLIFSGASTISTGTFKVGNVASTSATLSLTGTTDITSSAAFTNIAGSATSSTGVINIGSGNALRVTGTSGGNLASGTTASGVIYNAGTLTQTATTANNAGVYLGNAASSYGYLYNTGTATISGRMYVGRVDTANQAGSVGLVDIAGGTVTVSGTNQTVASGSQGSFLLNTNSANSGTARPSTGYAGVNVHGGTLSLGQAQTFQTNVGANLYTSINVTGSGSKIATTGAAGFNLNFTSAANNTTTLALHNGGSLETSLISNTGSAASTGILSFDNGTLKATAADATGLIQSGVTTYIQSGGATIDTNGFNTTVATALQAPTASGVTAINLPGGELSGYVGAPIVQISGGGGTGAAAVAVFDPSSGKVTGITITSAGSGYTTTPTITLAGGKGGTTGAATDSVTATATITAFSGTGGGLTKIGTGTLTLSAANTYTGATTVSAGTLSVTGSLASGSAVSVASGATLRGTGTIGGATTIASGGTLKAGISDSSIGTLTFSSTLDTTGATVSLKLNSNSADLLTASGAVTLGSATLTLSDISGGATWTGNSSAFSIVHGASISGTFLGLADGSTVHVGSNDFTLNYTGTDVTLTASAIPEPATYAALAGVLTLGAVVIRRRRQTAV